MRPNESFVGYPVRSLQTMLRVLAEHDSSLPAVIPDGIYGPTTMQAVAAFQRKAQLPATGTVDEETWKLIVNFHCLVVAAVVVCAAVVDVEQSESIEILVDPGKVFHLGDSSPYIYLLQSILLQLSNDHITIPPPPHTGVLDAETVESLKQFQQLANLEQNGQVDKLTWKYLSKHFTLNAHHNDRIERTNRNNR